MASPERTKRSVTVAGHATSVSLEPEFWDAFRALCRRRTISARKLIEEIDAGRTTNLSSAIRLFVLRDLQAGAGVPAPKRKSKKPKSARASSRRRAKSPG